MDKNLLTQNTGNKRVVEEKKRVMYGLFVCVSYVCVHFRFAFVPMDGTVGVYPEKERLWRSIGCGEARYM